MLVSKVGICTPDYTLYYPYMRNTVLTVFHHYTFHQFTLLSRIIQWKGRGWKNQMFLQRTNKHQPLYQHCLHISPSLPSPPTLPYAQNNPFISCTGVRKPQEKWQAAPKTVGEMVWKWEQGQRSRREKVGRKEGGWDGESERERKGKEDAGVFNKQEIEMSQV